MSRTSLILRDAFLGQRRYDEFQGSLGIASNILANRLQSLCEAGVLEKLQYQSGPDRFEYRLSGSGLDFHKSLLTMIAWGDRWIFDRETAPPVELTHRLCAARLHPRLACATCGQEIDAPGVDYAYVRPQSLGPRGGAAARRRGGERCGGGTGRGGDWVEISDRVSSGLRPV